MTPLLTTTELMLRWGKCRRAIEKMKKERRIEFIKIGRSVRFEESAVARAEIVFKAKGLIR